MAGYCGQDRRQGPQTARPGLLRRHRLLRHRLSRQLSEICGTGDARISCGLRASIMPISSTATTLWPLPFTVWRSIFSMSARIDERLEVHTRYVRASGRALKPSKRSGVWERRIHPWTNSGVLRSSRRCSIPAADRAVCQPPCGMRWHRSSRRERRPAELDASPAALCPTGHTLPLTS